MRTPVVWMSAAAVSLAGFGGVALSTSSSSTAAKPSITLTSASQSGKSIKVVVAPRNFTFAPASVGKANRARHGHFHLFVNGTYVGFAATKVATIRPGGITLTAGKSYKISVQLSTNNHTTFGARSRSITIRWK